MLRVISILLLLSGLIIIGIGMAIGNHETSIAMVAIVVGLGLVIIRHVNVLNKKLLLLALGIIIIGVGTVTGYRDMAISAVVISLGFAIIIYANTLDKKYLQEQERRHTQKMKQEWNKLRKISSWPTGKVLKTDSELDLGMFLFSLFFIVMGPILIRKGMTLNPVSWEIILASGCMLVVAVLYLSRIIPYLGKPAFELSQDGFFTPRWGFIPWYQVLGIHLWAHTGIFGSCHYSLDFRIKNSQSILKKHWMRRVLIYLGLVRTQDDDFNIVIILHSKHETPETIEIMTRFLWEKATGRPHGWNPFFFDEYSEGVKRISESSVNMEDDQEDKILLDLLEKLKSNEESLKIITDELNREESQRKRIDRIAQYCLILTVILLSLLKKFFS